MSPGSLLAFSAALFCGVLAFAAPLRNRHSPASWWFFAGMATLALESLFGGLSLLTPQAEKVAYWQSFVLVAKSFLPGFWLAFSLTYSRGNSSEFLKKWRLFLATAFLLPIGVALAFRSDLIQLLPPANADEGWGLSFSRAGNVVNVLCLIGAVMALNNLEKTFRSAIGTMRWRIKFVVVGLAVIFASRIYSLSQEMLYPAHDLALAEFESAALLVGCALITVAYLRDGFADIDVYPSHSVLQGTITVLLAGGYLFAIGLLAQLIALLGEAGSFRAHAFLVLLGVVGLAVLLLSERLRQKIQGLVSRHFKRPQHDFRKVWLLFTKRMSGVLDQDAVCAAAARLISETFNVLSVSIWRIDERKGRLICAGSTAQVARDDAGEQRWLPLESAIPPKRGSISLPFNLDETHEEWAENLKNASTAHFRTGGNRICLPLSSGGGWLGCAILADRVNGLPYTIEEFELLKCIGDQIAASLLNLRLTDELMLEKELEAFQTMSAFFVHDLKNATSTLSLTLQNLPVHFDDPEFRRDALRGIENTLNRINLHISRLSVLRNKLELKPTESDLNQLVIDTLRDLNDMPGVELVKDLHPLPKVVIDREQLQSVVTNLLLNARDAVGSHGQIRIETGQREGLAVLSVADNGCGMSPDFLRDSLFRPFQTTKRKGLGIGMFQSKMIVEAHRGNIQVESVPGKGTRFGVTLPLTG
ncbi:MAG TPA: XrtA/PEP-CTERM system histidine kinase PrsK [Terrimicrobiaceae bacterium]